MWRRRDILGALGTGAAGLALVANKAQAFDQASGGDDPKHAGMAKSCCDACGACAEACNKAFHHCVEQASAGKPRHAKMAQMVADCAAFCALSAEMISRHSTLMILSCRACADAWDGTSRPGFCRRPTFHSETGTRTPCPSSWPCSATATIRRSSTRHGRWPWSVRRPERRQSRTCGRCPPGDHATP